VVQFDGRVEVGGDYGDSSFFGGALRVVEWRVKQSFEQRSRPWRQPPQ